MIKVAFFRRSVQNRILTIVGIQLTFTLVLILVAFYLVNTLNMVTSISRAERNFTFHVLAGQVSAHRYLDTPSKEHRENFYKNIDFAYYYAKVFGNLLDLVQKKSANEVAKMLDDQYIEFDRDTSEVIVNRVIWMGWLPQVKNLISIADEGQAALKEYRKFTTEMFNSPSAADRSSLIPQWHKRSVEVLSYPTRFSHGTGVLSSFVLRVVIGAGIGLFLLIATISTAISLYIARSIVQPVRAETDRLLESASTISSTASQSSTTAAEQSAAITQMTSTFDEINQMSSVAAENAQTVLSSSSESTNQGRDGLTQVEKAVEIINAISEVNTVVETVGYLAEQSNLLALNASIEAAKAGETGRGFSVVAQEVRKLANQSKSATIQIRGAISRTEDGRHAIAEVHRTVAMLAESLQNNADKAKRISEATIHQSMGIKQINDAMQQISVGSQDTVGAVRELEHAVENISSIAQRLNKVITG